MGPWRQGAIAARPSATYKGYLMGGIAWFSIPFTMATTLGLCGRALDLPITIAESNNGLVPPAVATHLLGQGGSFLILLQLFMAVTASAASEQVGISSIVSYDIYKRYIAPNATGKQIVFVARCSIFAWACISGCLSIILNELKVRAGPDGPCRPPLPIFPFFFSRFVLLNRFPLVLLLLPVLRVDARRLSPLTARRFVGHGRSAWAGCTWLWATSSAQPCSPWPSPSRGRTALRRARCWGRGSAPASRCSGGACAPTASARCCCPGGRPKTAAFLPPLCGCPPTLLISFTLTPPWSVRLLRGQVTAAVGNSAAG